MVSTLDQALRNLKIEVTRPAEATDEEMREIEETIQIFFLKTTKKFNR